MHLAGEGKRGPDGCGGLPHHPAASQDLPPGPGDPFHFVLPCAASEQPVLGVNKAAPSRGREPKGEGAGLGLSQILVLPFRQALWTQNSRQEDRAVLPLALTPAPPALSPASCGQVRPRLLHCSTACTLSASSGNHSVFRTKVTLCSALCIWVSFLVYLCRSAFLAQISNLAPGALLLSLCLPLCLSLPSTQFLCLLAYNPGLQL